MSKLRTAALGLMLSAATLPIFNCTTIGPWTESRRDYVPTGVERKVEKEVSRETTKEKKFEISDLIEKDNSYFVGVSNSLWETNYQLKDISKTESLIEIINEERKVVKFSTLNQTGLIIIPMLTTGGGALLGGYAGGVDKNGKPNILTISIGAGLGLLGGIAADISFARYIHKNPEKETRRRVAEKVKQGTPIFERTEKRILKEGWVYQNQPAKNAAVRLSLGERWAYVLTDANGEINLPNLVGEGFFFPGQDASESYLEKIVGGNSLIGQVKSQTLNILLKEFINSVQRYNHTLRVSTNEASSENEKVSNASRDFVISTYEINDTAIYDIVRKFVEKEINPSIQPVKIYVRDFLSHTPISNSTFQFTTDAPSKARLAGEYFTGELREFAEKSIPDYLIGSKVMQNCPDNFVVMFYNPSRAFVEVINPLYNFRSGEFYTPNWLTKPLVIDMAEKGKKVRVQQAEEELGPLEE